VRYPRGTGVGADIKKEMGLLDIGKGRVMRNGHKVAILAFGTCTYDALEAANNLDASVVDMRFVKPLDKQLMLEMAEKHQLLVTVEENALAGGAGSAVNEFLLNEGKLIPILNIGLPDAFVVHGSQKELRALYHLDAQEIENKIREKLSRL
jgi:1-deoxy-D-xylulose-5-phosphate synthase